MEDRRKDDVKIEVLTERVNNWMESTETYRKTLCMKLDNLTDKMNNLPCDGRVEQTKGIKIQLKGLWIAVSAIFVAILAEWSKMK